MLEISLNLRKIRLESLSEDGLQKELLVQI